MIRFCSPSKSIWTFTGRARGPCVAGRFAIGRARSAARAAAAAAAAGALPTPLSSSLSGSNGLGSPFFSTARYRPKFSS